MHRSRALAALLGLALLLLPAAGLECSPTASAPMSCCDEPLASCHELSAQETCCEVRPGAPTSPSAERPLAFTVLLASSSTPAAPALVPDRVAPPLASRRPDASPPRLVALRL